MKKPAKIFAFSLLLLLIISTSIFLLTFYMLKDVSLDETKLIRATETISIYSDKGKLITDKINANNGNFIKIENLKEHTKNAFIAIEDKRFYSHNGVDYKRILGAILNNIKSLSFKEGASTITQQLIKNTHLSSDKTIKRKLKEIKLATQLESTFSKNEILEAYLNTIYFGSGAYGIEEASNLYFNKSAENLTINESAMLAGIIKSPKNYSPIYNFENSINRKNLVLSCMNKCGFIDDKTYNTLKNEKITINHNKQKLYYSDYLSAVLREFESLNLLEPYNNSSIKINTFLDETLQNNISNNNLKYDVIKIIINSKTNGVTAFYGDYSNLKRNPASCVKPWLVYAPMINDNYIKQSSIVNDEPINFNGYSPKNFDDKSRGNVTVKQAIELSLNVPAVKLLSGFGIDKANSYTKKFGIDIKTDGLASALGSVSGGISLKDLSDIYSVFNHNGNFTKSSFIKSIYVDNVKIYEFKPNFKKVFSEETAFIINDMLNSAVKNGTSKNLRTLPFMVCAKTGTNGDKNGNIDALSISYTTDSIVGVWVGNYDGSAMPNTVTGGNQPTKISKQIYEKLYSNYKPNDFSTPKNIVKKFIDSNQLYKNQQELISENGIGFYYKLGTEPHENLITKPTLKSSKLQLKSGILNINLETLNADSIEIIKKFKNKKVTVYNGEPISNFNETLTEFGVYEYTIIAKNKTFTETFKLPLINYLKSSLISTDDDFWLKE